MAAGGEIVKELLKIGQEKPSNDEAGVVRGPLDTNAQAAHALRESYEKFEYVFENSVIGKSITLPTGEIQVNTAFQEMLGYSREELKNKKWQDISFPDDIESTQRVIDSLVRGEKNFDRFQKRYVHKSGRIVWADVGTALRRASDGPADAVSGSSILRWSAERGAC